MAIPQHIAKGVLRAGGPVVIVAGTNLAKYLVETPDDAFGRLRPSPAAVPRVLQQHTPAAAPERPQQRVLESTDAVVWNPQPQKTKQQRQQRQKNNNKQQQYHKQYQQQYQQSFQYQKPYQYDQPDQDEGQSQPPQHNYDYDSYYQSQEQPQRRRQQQQHTFSTIDPITHDFSLRPNRQQNNQQQQQKKQQPQPVQQQSSPPLLHKDSPERKQQVSMSGRRASVNVQPVSPSIIEHPMHTRNNVLNQIPSTPTAVAAAVTPASPSSRLLQDFILEEEIGRGGFGRVFRAKNRFDLLDYAAKVVINQVIDTSSYNEARILAKINHPNIVRYHCAWLEPLEGELQSLMLTKNSHSNNSSRDVSSVSHSIHPLSQSGHLSVSSTKLLSSSNLSSPCSRASNKSDVYSFMPHLPHQSASLSSLSSIASLSSNTSPHFGSEKASLESMGSECSTISSSALVLQMELLSNWTLADWIAVDRGPTWSQTVVMVFSQILEALDYIHSRGIVHRDVKPSNVFFAQAPSQTEMPFVKLGDFGLSLELRSSKPSEHKLEFGSRNTAGVGTAIYASPEQNSGNSCDGKADMFALGIMLFECLAPRFNTMSERLVILQALRKGDVPSSFLRQHPQISELVLSLISLDPNHRPAARQVLGLPLFHVSSAILFPEVGSSRYQNTPPLHLNLAIRRLEEDLRRRDATIARLSEQLRSLQTN